MLTDEQKREILAKCREDIDCFDEVEDELFWFDNGTPAQEPQRDQDSFDEGQDSIKEKVWDVINMMEAYTKKDDLGNLPKKTLIEIIVKTNDALHEIAR